MEDANKRKRKEEAKALKRKRIEESGGVRPRRVIDKVQPDHNGKKTATTTTTTTTTTATTTLNEHAPNRRPPTRNFQQHNKPTTFSNSSTHRFGRVMESVPCRNKPRHSTLSIAIPGSVVSNCQTRELKTQLVGQIARACAVFHVDEVIVFDDKLAATNGDHRGYHRSNNRPSRDNNKHPSRTTNKEQEPAVVEEEKEDAIKELDPTSSTFKRSDPHTFMARVLQYCECPQYLRRQFFPMHPDLQFTGLLSPLDSPHHVRAEERSKYREGVVLDKTGTVKGGSLVNCGIKNRPVEIDRVLLAGVRVTVELDIAAYGSTGKIVGTVVSPSAPREFNGTYWGYTTRLASSIHAVFEECPFENGYDLKIGTSERGTVTVDDKDFTLPMFKHSLIVFGGVAGIEECVDADETLKVPGSQSFKLFDMWVNTCPYQGSRTIRTEEAVLISLCRLSPHLAANNVDMARTVTKETQAIEFSDDEPSDESSCSED